MLSAVSLITSTIDNVRQYISPAALSLEEVLSDLSLNNDVLKRVMAEMTNQMNLGLIYGLEKSSISMLPSFVPGFFDKSDETLRRYLALDLGGTNLRVLLLEIGRSDGELEAISRNFRIPNAVMIGSADDLFGFIVGCMEKFLDEKQLIDTPLNLGFTFSYPCQQKGLNSSILIRWTKGFNVNGVEGQDVVKMLQEAIDRNGRIKVRVIALMNDTVGTQIATAFDHKKCDLAVVVATGTNASYVEKTVNIPKIQDSDYPYEQMIIDTEWGGFGDHGEIDYVKTEFDRTVDANSVHPGVQSFDKLVGGMCMGEVARLVLVKLIKHRLIFANCHFGLLLTTSSFPTKFISEILSDEGGRLYNTRQILEELGVDGFVYSDLILLREIVACVSRRSANLAAAAISSMVLRIGKKKVLVGIDGSTYRFHPFYHSWVKEKIRELLPPEFEVNLVQAGDGSGKGAALVAAIAEKLEMERQKA